MANYKLIKDFLDKARELDTGKLSDSIEETWLIEDLIKEIDRDYEDYVSDISFQAGYDDGYDIGYECGYDAGKGEV